MRDSLSEVTVLVTDGETRSSLAVTRSLGRAGCHVIVVGCRKRNLASCSRYCGKQYSVPSPLKKPWGFLESIQSIVKREKVQVIYPMTEPSIMVLAENRDKFPSHAILAAPDIQKVRAVFDKIAVFRLAKELNVAIPQTVFVKNRDDFEQKKDLLPDFPVVVKPCMSRIPIGSGFLNTNVRYALDEKDLESIYGSERVFAEFPSLIQEKIVGEGTGLFTLFDKNRHLALFAHKRLLEKPPSGGVSVVCQSVPLDEEMVKYSAKLLCAVEWEGVAMVEFKRDVRDGRPKLMEINGRFWGSLQLAISSGVNFPIHLMRYLMGGDDETLFDSYIVGLKMKWILGILDHFLIRLRSKTKKKPSSICSSLIRIALDPSRICRERSVYDVFDPQDIKPFLCELREYVLAREG